MVDENYISLQLHSNKGLRRGEGRRREKKDKEKSFIFILWTRRNIFPDAFLERYSFQKSELDIRIAPNRANTSRV